MTVRGFCWWSTNSSERCIFSTAYTYSVYILSKMWVKWAKNGQKFICHRYHSSVTLHLYGTTGVPTSRVWFWQKRQEKGYVFWTKMQKKGCVLGQRMNYSMTILENFWRMPETRVRCEPSISLIITKFWTILLHLRHLIQYADWILVHDLDVYIYFVSQNTVMQTL